MIATHRQRTVERIRGRAGAAAACMLGVLALVAGTAHAQAGAESTSTDPTAAEGSATPAAATEAPAEGSATAAPAKSTRLVEARARPTTAYFYGLKKIRFAIRLVGKTPTDVRIDIVRRSGLVERSITQPGVAPNSRVVIPWDGLSSSGAPLQGKFRFLVKGANGRPIPFARRYAAQRAGKGGKKRGPQLNFALRDHIFPVRGKHSYGDGIGAPRGDHTHQGQDVAASCGTKLVAATAGTVQVNAYQEGGAGYYVVLDAVASDVDYVYMHLLAPPALVAGQLVLTGQQFGQVGNTGSSSGCHLHFEMWSAPGWYEGGTFIDPAGYMRTWDKYS